jgi:hypothetical protein
MNMVCVNEGKKYCLQNALKPTAGPSSGYRVRLFKNDYTPEEDSVTGDFTEADFTGYAEVAITQSNWPTPVIVDDIAECTSTVTPTYTATGGGGQLVYGWYMVEADFSTCLFAQRFDTPRNMISGAVETLNPFKISLKTLD